MHKSDFPADPTRPQVNPVGIGASRVNGTRVHGLTFFYPVDVTERAMQTANYITYYLQPDNRIVVGFQYNQWWYSCHAGVVLYLFDFAGKNGS
jgi:hypothetical protein